MEFLDIAFACTISQIFPIIMRYTPFAEIVTKKQKKTLLIIYSIALFFNFLIHLMIAHMGALTFTVYKQGLVIFSVLMTIVNIVVIKNRLREHLFTCGLTAVFILSCFTVVSYLELSIFSKTPDKTHIIINIIMLIIMFIASFPIIKHQIERSVKPFLSIEPDSYWENIWIVPCAMFITCYLPFFSNTYAYSLPLALSRVFMTVSTFFMCRSIASDYERIKEQKELYNQLDMQKKYYEALSENVEKTRKSRHDLKHHLTAIIGFADADDKAGLINYCNNLTNMQYGEVDIPYSGNAAIDGVLYHYAGRAKKHNIDFKIQGLFKTDGIDDVDICAMLGNALDNAITACCTIKDKRFINITTKTDGNVLAIMISNSFDGIIKNKHENIMSRKAKNREGVGLTSIKSVCEKYGGTLNIDYNDTTFTCMMLLNLQTKTE
ncbi:MAG: ATP-binding protein [Acutalibacteraceae bacterium]|nr:ATP-binding protein [Acutalibacteraceae bacterium]